MTRAWMIAGLLAACTTGTDDDGAAVDTGPTTETGMLPHTGAYAGCTEAGTAVESLPEGAWADAMPDWQLMDGSKQVTASWADDGSDFDVTITLAVDPDNVWVQRYTDPVACPDKWALLVDWTVDRTGVASASGSEPQTFRVSDVAPSVDIWWFVGTWTLQGADATRASTIAGFDVTDVSVGAYWDGTDELSFEVWTAPEDDTTDETIVLASKR